MPQEISPLIYCRYQFQGFGDFMASYRELDEKDKADLKQWAKDEMAAFAAEGKPLPNITK